ncbi:MAG: Nif3-like dinuclear metal center hexameric protein [Glaciecola sp.]|jgi:dinuclear metal center YbgI/SA1388 family protein|nr:Nif3-like dinuclear metal center hexameric protein [Glaciecola sp.]MDG2100414.1 Nif3-like dinuclear metal center hexameric protein [Glaciecola sp.]
MHNFELEKSLNTLLKSDSITDYCPNGLQVQGRQNVQKVITGVTASLALIEQAIAHNADAIIVHHGYFWKGENQTICHMKQQRIKALLTHDINLYAYHLPLDVHPTLGNNAQLAARLGINNVSALNVKPEGVLMRGEFEHAIPAQELVSRVEHNLNRSPLVLGNGFTSTNDDATQAQAQSQTNQPNSQPRLIKHLAWCTGGGQGYLEAAAQAGVDAFITGEASEQTTHIAHEYDVMFIGAGHHATERYGVQALGEHIQSQWDLDVSFIDLSNPV